MISKYAKIGIVFGGTGIILLNCKMVLPLIYYSTPPQVPTSWCCASFPTNPWWINFLQSPLYISITLSFLLVAIFFLIFEIGRIHGIREEDL